MIQAVVSTALLAGALAAMTAVVVIVYMMLRLLGGQALPLMSGLGLVMGAYVNVAQAQAPLAATGMVGYALAAAVLSLVGSATCFLAAYRNARLGELEPPQFWQRLRSIGTRR